MTGDLGPDVAPPAGAPLDELSGTFDAYLVPATGLASEIGDDEAVNALTHVAQVHAAFADPPITQVGEHSRAVVEVTLRGSEGDESLEVRVASLLDQVAAADGFHVGRVHLRR